MRAIEAVRDALQRTPKGRNARSWKKQKSRCRSLKSSPDAPTHTMRPPLDSLTHKPPIYTEQEKAKAETELRATFHNRWYKLLNRRIWVPSSIAWDVVQEAHHQMHMGKTALAQALSREVYINKVHSLVAHASKRCTSCARNNAWQRIMIPLGKQPKGDVPFDMVTIDFTDMLCSDSYVAMLVLVCSYTR